MRGMWGRCWSRRQGTGNSWELGALELGASCREAGAGSRVLVAGSNCSIVDIGRQLRTRGWVPENGTIFF